MYLFHKYVLYIIWPVITKSGKIYNFHMQN